MSSANKTGTNLFLRRPTPADGRPASSQASVAFDLNHLIVWCVDKEVGADHLVEILGLKPPRHFAGLFLVVDLGNGVSLDYADWRGGDLTPQHLAFLVGEDEFDAAYGRIMAKGIEYWADPSKRTVGKINHHDGGRGLYWEDPEGHCSRSSRDPMGPRPKRPGVETLCLELRSGESRDGAMDDDWPCF